MHTVLLPLDDRINILPSLTAGALLRQKFGSYIDGVAIGPDIPEARTVDMPWSSSSLFDPLRRREMASRIRDRFDQFYSSHSVPEHFQSRQQPSFGFAGSDLVEDAEVGVLARLYDITVLPKLDVASDVPRMATLLSVMLTSGRPTMIVPPTLPQCIGKDILLVWNGSIEGARALGVASPFLDKAARIYVMSCSRDQTSKVSARELAVRLRIRGIDVSLVPLDDDNADPSGEHVLAVASKLGADLLIRGAYSRSPLRQMFLGGVTRYLLEHSHIPMLLAH
jgi:nucleotide-binding universal stress UspA family protein